MTHSSKDALDRFLSQGYRPARVWQYFIVLPKTSHYTDHYIHYIFHYRCIRLCFCSPCFCCPGSSVSKTGWSWSKHNTWKASRATNSFKPQSEAAGRGLLFHSDSIVLLCWPVHLSQHYNHKLQWDTTASCVFLHKKMAKEWQECRVREVNTTAKMSIIHWSIVFIASVQSRKQLVMWDTWPLKVNILYKSVQELSSNTIHRCRKIKQHHYTLNVHLGLLIF